MIDALFGFSVLLFALWIIFKLYTMPYPKETDQ